MYSASRSIICRHTNTGDRTKASTNSTNGLILLLFLDGQANVCKHMCMYYKSFQLLGLVTHSTLELFGLFMPHCLLNTCTCSAANPKHHRFSSSSPWTPLCSCSSQLPQLPHSASVSHPSPKATLPVCWPVQLGTLCDCTWTYRSSCPALLAPQTHQPLWPVVWLHVLEVHMGTKQRLKRELQKEIDSPAG